MNYTIQLQRSSSSRLAAYDFNNILFGQNPTDHLFSATYRDGRWQDATVGPFQEFLISPLALCLHYGQNVFEGMKAFRMENGQISIFRPDKHLQRLNRSLERMCMPEVPQELFIGALDTLIGIDEAWVSDLPGNSLYLRPLVFASEARLGVHEAAEYKFLIMAMPIANYYNGSVRVKVETRYTRAAEGGAGFAKHGGNYGPALLPTRLAKQEGFDQVLWTDGKTHTFIEESGTMNVMFVIDGTLITPPLTDTILDGVNRDAILTIARERGLPVEERAIAYTELEEAFKNNKSVEAFGIGTAAVFTPIREIAVLGTSYYPSVQEKSLGAELSRELNNIRTGKQSDRYGWNHIVQVTKKAEIAE
ncbi:branched-chain amino acid aminotransferase [Pedobacter sp. AK017]|uniref:branched-chain amino acid aminotransferase n=1 Tax=Pedobacter sp. AK017 TaxID=2723073 RepID=UPI0016133684|nr:branched-chain amino acid aminotransferase [Pedobacter sp. AK017]MBB5438336.1 branched-chain amino acid aminotransferase [Pedobacter sp. AK017]